MHAEYLVKMANDIGTFFHGDVGSAAAPAEIARHIQRFWDRRMRQQNVAHLGTGGAGLTPEARRAVEIIAAQPAAAPR